MFCSGSLIADLFSSSSRGVANGIFSWGVYYGYGLAFVIGIYGTQADIMGFGWRAPYVLVAIPGIIIAILLATTVKDPRQVDIMVYMIMSTLYALLHHYKNER